MYARHFPAFNGSLLSHSPSAIMDKIELCVRNPSDGFTISLMKVGVAAFLLRALQKVNKTRGYWEVAGVCVLPK